MTTAIEHLEKIIHGVQALRRSVERLSSPYQGGTGIRCQFYAHQLQTTKRILSDTRVRHLIADEVGMGKTIQSLMIMNALRLQRGGNLRTTIIVPRERLAKQWSDEVCARAHCIAELEDHPAEGEFEGFDCVNILWDAKIMKPLVQLSPSSCDLMIVDEIQKLNSETLRAIIRFAPEYQHLLVLTATPDLSTDKRLLELLEILESTRVSIAKLECRAYADVAGMEGTDTEEVVQRVVGKIMQQRSRESEVAKSKYNLQSEPDHILTPWFDLAWYPFRRVIRSQRKDYPSHFPKRLIVTAHTEPLATEHDRLQRIREYVNSNVQFGDTDLKAIMRRAFVGGEALRDRIGDLQRRELDPYGALSDVRQLCSAELGNSRLDEVLDWLCDFWIHGVDRKVLVTAQDNPTVQFLERQIPAALKSIGPHDDRRNLKLMTMISERDSQGDLIEAYIDEKRESFEFGDCQIAIVHSDFKEGYNFQSADALVFYEMPWSPEDVDQWIGRVDRLGRRTKDPGRPFTQPVDVTILCIGYSGEFDSRLIHTFESSNVLSKPRLYDPDESTAISEEIHRAAKTAEEDSLFNVADYLCEAPKSYATSVLEPPAVFGTPKDATEALFAQVKLVPVEPAFGKHTLEGKWRNERGYVGTDSEAAVSRWLWLLGAQKYLNIITKKGAGKRESFYVAANTRRSELQLAVLAHSDGCPFFLARNHIQRPARRFVEYSWNDGTSKKILQFFDHGASLHEQLINTCIKLGRQNNPRYDVPYWNFRLHLYAENLRIDSKLTVGEYVTSIGVDDPTVYYSSLDRNYLAADLLEGLDDNTTKAQTDSKEIGLRSLFAGLEADARFIRINAGVSLRLSAVRLDEPAESVPDLAPELFTIVWKSDAPPAECVEIPTNKSLAVKVFESMERKLSKDAKVRRNPQLKNSKECIARRRFLLEVDRNECLQLIELEIGSLQQRIDEHKKHATDRNQRVIDTTFMPQMRLLEQRRLLENRTFNIRRKFLQKAEDYLEAPQIDAYVCLKIEIVGIFEPAQSVTPILDETTITR